MQQERSKLFVSFEIAVPSWARKKHLGRSLGFLILGCGCWGRGGTELHALGFTFQRLEGRMA